MATTFADPATFSGAVTFTNTVTLPSLASQLPTGIPRAALTQDDLKLYPIPLTDARVHDAIGTLLPATSATDDLGLKMGKATATTFGTDAPIIQTYDVKAAGSTTLYARFPNVRVPAEYVDGQTLVIQIRAAMVTTVAGVACTIDVAAHEIADDGSVGADICATAAQDMNSLTPATYTFTLTPTNLASGDLIDLRVAIAPNDAATATAVYGAIFWIKIACDVKG
jgi:hypothetical protein